MGKENLKFDCDKAIVVSTGDNNYYFQVEQGTDGFYVTLVCSADADSLVFTILDWVGPFEQSPEAYQMAISSISEWQGKA